MPVNWEAGDTQAHKKAHEAACVSGEFDYTVPTWDIYTDLREALIWGLMAVGFPAKSSWEITEGNWRELYIRLTIYEEATGCKRIYGNGDNPRREMRFTPEEIHSCIGFYVNAGNKSDAQFKTWLVKRLRENAQFGLDRFDKPHTDVYHYQRKHMESSLGSKR